MVLDDVPVIDGETTRFIVSDRGVEVYRALSLTDQQCLLIIETASDMHSANCSDDLPLTVSVSNGPDFWLAATPPPRDQAWEELDTDLWWK